MSPFDTASARTEALTRPLALSRQTEPSGRILPWRAMSIREQRILFERALDSLWLAFQPIVSVAGDSAGLFAYEALARNAEPQVSAPRDLLALAVSVGMVTHLGRVVHRRAAEALRANDSLKLFVNVDVEELMGPLSDDGDGLDEFADRVVLEVTERAPISELPEVRERASAIRFKGYRFAIDDLGGGYAGLSSLALMDPDFVKIDQALIRSVDTDPVKRKIVGTLVTLTRQLGIGCIVEGVETIEERDVLLGLECNLMQGYLFGRPAEF